jgi:hypothetical protein
MYEWLANFIVKLFGSRARDALLRSQQDLQAEVVRGDQSREDFRLLKEAFSELYAENKALLKLTQEMAQHMTQRIEALETELSSIRSSLELEKTAHKECRQQLAQHEEKIKILEGKISLIQQRQTDH